MEYIQSLLNSSTTPVLTAFLLGLLTAVSPCPLATNITAIGFISRDIDSRNRVFWGGMLYTFGRVITYTIIGIIVIPIIREGSSMFAIQKVISKYGELIVAPALILIGVYMLGLIKINIGTISIEGNRFKDKCKGLIGAVLLGIVFSLAFCPTSGLFYFGILIPMSAATAGGYWLPVVFAIATGLPVIIVAWVVAYSISGIGRFYNAVQAFERWFRKLVALLFIAVGIYYMVVFFL